MSNISNIKTGNNDFTFCLWYKPTSQPGADTKHSLFYAGADLITRDSLGLAYSDVGATKKLTFLAHNDNKSENQILTNGTWYWLCITYTASTRTVQFYVNNVSIGTEILSGDLDIIPASIIVGSDLEGNNADGLFDDVRYVESILTDYEMDFIYNDGDGQLLSLNSIVFMTTIVETIDFKIPNSFYGLGVESGLLDSYMKNNINLIGLQALNTLTPTSHEDLKVDIFSDATGYLNTVVVGDTTATFDSSYYKRVTADDEVVTLVISGVTETKTACQLYVNTLDMEPGCSITYDVISADDEEELNIPINQYHEIQAFTPTAAKLNNGTIVIHLKNDAVSPTEGFPSVQAYGFKLW